ncbi:hypothetical protein [Rhizobium sp. PP-F2F-G48]|uniref:hypothetical protein n=1 Tax=Rhizobium sp. PP-F2F-G48 TaxID=2135651 RepID=UPI00104C4435|nr:hypothetical protein [Rhizobium sp. PP-F2F-G48]
MGFEARDCRRIFCTSSLNPGILRGRSLCRTRSLGITVTFWFALIYGADRAVEPVRTGPKRWLRRTRFSDFSGRRLFNASPVAIVVLDAAEQTDFANASAIADSSNGVPDTPLETPDPDALTRELNLADPQPLARGCPLRHQADLQIRLCRRHHS